ncbi:BlaI/MecI/CopY family transcriptional regulator [Microbacter margulisiae]|uniref:Putative transcriptional regulator n=1 Tax=Microbacter margulisiae TaxID=1350067 RepID=A0A7W5H387_9PORP|nr:BlaI/MecI/CopY family transcriptional regulator [Microbacter margulisiae]MBB3188359.1 putative transcriptional regulator [Microbacter margulisiae]
MQQLTKAEEQIMQQLWEMGEGIVADIRDRFPDPKPARNTVSTIIRILEQKEFVSHKAYGKTFVYFPLVSKTEYSKKQITNILHNYFNNSFAGLTSFFAKENNLSVQEIDEIMKTVKDEINNTET